MAVSAVKLHQNRVTRRNIHSGLRQPASLRSTAESVAARPGQTWPSLSRTSSRSPKSRIKPRHRCPSLPSTKSRPRPSDVPPPSAVRHQPTRRARALADIAVTTATLLATFAVAFAGGYYRQAPELPAAVDDRIAAAHRRARARGRAGALAVAGARRRAVRHRRGGRHHVHAGDPGDDAHAAAGDHARRADLGRHRRRRRADPDAAGRRSTPRPRRSPPCPAA